jgi:hypothetical protein
MRGPTHCSHKVVTINSEIITAFSQSKEFGDTERDEK